MTQPPSPATQVMIAVAGVYKDHDLDPPARLIAAAALRAVANQAQARVTAFIVLNDYTSGWKMGVLDCAQGLLAIAAELEAPQ